MENGFFGAALCFVVGALISFLNYKMSEHMLKKDISKYSMISVVRQVIQVGYLLILFFAAKYTPWDRTYCLVGGALGITLPMFFFTYKLLKIRTDADLRKGENEDG